MGFEERRQPFLRARQRGEISGDQDIELALDELTGPVYYRVLMTRQPVPRSFTDALVDRYLGRQET